MSTNAIDKTCPICGAAFVCRPETPELCQCAGIVLTESVRERLKQRYPGQCICRKCLLANARSMVE